MKKLLIIALYCILGLSIASAYTPISRQRNFVNDANNSIPITASYMDGEFNNLVSAINGTLIAQGSAPSSPFTGEFWYDTTTKLLKLYRNSEWINYSPVFGGTSYMTTPQKGDLFVNWNSFPSLQEYTGTTWVNAAYVASSGINWTDINLHSTLNTGSVNWSNFTTNNLPSKGVNWQDILGDSSGKYLTDNGNNTVNWSNAPTFASVSGNYVTGSYLISGPSSITSAFNSSATKIVELLLPRGGSLSITFGLARTNTSTANAQIYRNGSTVGTLRSTSSSTWTEYTETIGGWTAGDLLQLYMYSSSGSDQSIGGAVRVYENSPIKETFGSGGLGNGAGELIYSGNVTPPSALGAIGDLYTNTAGGASTTLYVKTGSSTWTAK